MLRRSQPRRALPLIKLLILATRQVTKPFAKMVISSATEYVLIDKMCIGAGRLLLGSTGVLRQEADKQREKAAEAAKAKIREAELIAHVRIEMEESVRVEVESLRQQLIELQELMVRHPPSSGSDANASNPPTQSSSAATSSPSGVDSSATTDERCITCTAHVPVCPAGTANRPALPHHRTLFGTDNNPPVFPPEPRIEVEPFAIPLAAIDVPVVSTAASSSSAAGNPETLRVSAVPTVPTASVSAEQHSGAGSGRAAGQQQHPNKQSSSNTRGGTTSSGTASSSSSSFKGSKTSSSGGGARFGGGSGGAFNFRKSFNDRYYAPVSDDTLRKAGAEIFVELFAFSILSLILTYEYMNAKRSEQQRESAQLARLRALEEKVNELAAKHTSVKRLTLGDAVLPKRSWFGLGGGSDSSSGGDGDAKADAQPKEERLDMTQRMLQKGLTP